MKAQNHMVGDILNVGSFFLDIMKKIYPDNKDISGAVNVADTVRSAYDVVSTTSIGQNARRTLLSPMVVVQGELLHQEYMPDLITVINIRDIVATLSHFAIRNAEQIGVNISSYLGRVNPNRAGLQSMIAGIEAFSAGNIDPSKPKPGEGSFTVGGKTIQELQEYVPLSIGRVVNATVFGKDGTSVELPLTFRQIIVPASSDSLENTFGVAKIDDGFKMRWIMRNNGEITNPEWFDGEDIIKERFKAMRNDDTKYYTEAQARDVRNKIEAVRTGVISLNTMANTFIITDDEKERIEMEIGKSFANPNSRKEIFKTVKANTIVICNESRGSFTFYTNGQMMPEIYTRRDLAIKTKKEPAVNSLEGLVKLLNGGI